MNILNYTACEIASLIHNREISSFEATSACLKRIDDFDGDLGCFLDVYRERALNFSLKADEKIKQNENLPTLFGVPYSLKDNILTKGLKTTCASFMLNDFIPTYSATVYEKLEKSGAILLGKTNMDEFAMGSSSEYSAFCVTKNPYNRAKIAGGSSGGSAACVASDMAYFSLGSDTGGSVRQPASFCGCVGLKPTYGRVSRYGLVAFASSLDQIGPITKDVRDCAAVLDLISGKDEKDATSAPISSHSFESALSGDIKGIKIGVPVEYLDGISQDVKAALLKSTENLKALGGEVCDTNLSLYKYALPAYYLISSGEASSNLARFDGIKYGYSKTDAETLDLLYKKSRTSGFGDEVKRRIMLGAYILSSENYSKYFEKAQKIRTLIIEEFNKLFDTFDVLISPAYPTVASNLASGGTSVEMYIGGNCQVCANLAGIPAVVLPCGYDKDGLPIGVQILGRQFDEAKILNVAYALEKTISKVKPPLKERDL